MQASDINIYFQFPEIVPPNKEAFLHALIENIPEDPKTGYAGYSDKKYLLHDLESKVEEEEVFKYVPLTTGARRNIEEEIKRALEKCFETLQVVGPLSIFVFPWLAANKDTAFEGVNGYTPYKNTFSLFISTAEYTHKSLVETVAHEYNHAVFFCFHPPPQTLLDSFISEGLAENFREEVVGGDPAPWSLALSVNECKEALDLLQSSLQRTDLYEDVFWDGKKYKKWTGYSVGYQIVKSFRKKHPELPWGDIMKMDSQEIFKVF